MDGFSSAKIKKILLKLRGGEWIKKTPTNFAGVSVVIPPRFERGTYCLEGSCSIQLSYGTFLFIGRDDSTRTSDPLVPNQVFCQLNYIPYLKTVSILIRF